MTRSGSDVAGPPEGDAGRGDGAPGPLQREPGRGEREPGHGDGEPGRGGGDAADRLWRRVLWSLPTGLYVLGSRAGDARNLMAISWVTQVATEPRQVGVGIERHAVTMRLVREGGAFALSLLAREDKALVRRFVKPVPADAVAVDGTGRGTMRGVGVHQAVTGAPVLDAAVAHVDCRVAHVLDLGSHCWVVGTVVDAGFAPDSEGAAVLAMADTRMNYGG